MNWFKNHVMGAENGTYYYAPYFNESHKESVILVLKAK